VKSQVLAVIPARLGSTRFPGKVLYEWEGKPLLWYIWREVTRAKKIDRVIIATDSQELFTRATAFGANCFLSKKKHRTGSDRVAEVAAQLKPEIVINIQADNFGLKGAVLDRALELFSKEKECPTATLARKIDDDRALFNPDIVKLVMTTDNRALWFSRFPLPYIRGASGDDDRWSQARFWEHIGVYLYRRAPLTQFARWPQGQAEKAESLEQLRLLENDIKMRVYPTRSRTVSIDSPDDVKKMIAVY
jgi:3-deoxy-manno-octulosonate cytidylyltransferase (CMP-KDO synthetase)